MASEMLRNHYASNTLNSKHWVMLGYSNSFKLTRMTHTMCVVVFLVVLCVGIEGREFKLGMLSPFRHPRLGWENNAAAATIAVEKAQLEGILVDHNISVLWRDDRCNNVGGTAGAMEFKNNDDVDVFIGPPCSGSTIPVGLLASYWNIPLFSQASTDPTLADKSVFTTLVRLGPPFNKMGKALVEFYNRYNWTNTVVVSKRRTDNRNVFCDYSYRSIEVEFENNDIEISEYIPIDAHLDDDEIDRVLERSRQRGRIILLCTEILADRRRILLAASRKGMTDGNYVYILPDHLPTGNVFSPWVNNDEDDVEAREAYLSAFQISVAEMAGPEVEAFRDTVSEKMAHPPWYYNYTAESGLRGSEYSAFLHDVVYLYLLVLNETIEEGLDHRNGLLLFEKAKGRTFRGMTGNVKVDSNGDREPDYWIWALHSDAQEYSVALQVVLTSTQSQKVKKLTEIIWRTPNNKAPPSTPACGFTNELCPVLEEKGNTQMIVIVTIVTIIAAVTLIVVRTILYRKAKFERELAQELWKIHYDDIRFTNNKLAGSISQLSLAMGSVRQLSMTGSSGGDRSVGQIFSHTGHYKGSVVAIKKLGTYKLNLQRPELLELKLMRDLHHENVNVFVGLCLNELYPCIVTTYCSKGSLEDIIENEDIKLDWMFKVSLINDVTMAVSYLHSSPIRNHGNLKSSNCVVDNRWVLKVTDYGLCRVRNQYRYSSESQHRLQSSLFWTAPELLDIDISLRSGSQKADIYALGILLYEILYRREPYNTTIYTPEEIISKVRARTDPPFRPSTMYDSNDNDWQVNEKTTISVKRLLSDCWTDDVDMRPSLSTIKQVISKLHNGKKINIVDNMVSMLEKYAVNLEGIVEQRTIQLLEEKKKTDMLLYRMLPPTVAEKLKKGQPVESEIYDAVTIYFSDIVGFTAISSSSSPMEIVDLLNELYTEFDDTIGQHDVYKVETIGDAYMAVSGLPVRNSGRHVCEIANLSLDLLKCSSRFKIRHKPDQKLQLRIGFHTGSCAAGVVGITMPRYCLFGDTVNMASRMESTGEAMKIHISQASKEALSKSNGYEITDRGPIEVKGKGTQQTFWLVGRSEDKTRLVDTDC